MAYSAQSVTQPSNVSVLRWVGADSELLELVRARDPRAAARVFDRFEADVNRVVWRCLGADAEHDDIVHDVFIQVLKGMHKVQRAGALRSWVMSVAINTARSELRRRRRRRVYWSKDAAPEVADPSLNPEARRTLAHVYTILDQLPADERIAFVLRFVEQHPLAEVAELTRCSLATAKRRIARATKAFDKLAAEDPDLAALSQGAKWRRG